VGAKARPRTPIETTPKEFDTLAMVRLLVQQRWIVIGVFVTVVAGTVFATLGMRKVYEASTTLEYDPSPPRPLGSEVEDVTTPATNFLASKEWYQTQNAIIASRTVARKVVERLALHRDPDFMDVPQDDRPTWTGGTLDDAIRQLSLALTIKQDRDTRVARISMRSTDPERAALLVNSIADAYMDWVMEERLGSTVRAVDWLSGQLDDISKQLERSEHDLYDFRRKNNVLSVSLEDQQNGISQTMHSFGAALTDATTQRIQVQAKLKQLEQAMAEDPMQVHATLVSSSSAVAGLRQRYHEAKVERDSLAVRYGPNHPEMRRNQEQLDTIVAAAREEIRGLVDALKADLREVEDVERGLRQARQQTQNEGLDLNLHEIDYNRMERERANNEKLHTILLQRTTETNLTRMLRVSPVRLVDRAAVPDEPIRPRPILNMALGIVLGLLGGIGAAVLRMRMDRSVNTPDDVANLGVAVLGLVPTIQADKTASSSGRVPRGGARGTRRKQTEATARSSKDLVVHTHPRSAVAECCRTIRTNLSFMSTDKPLRTILVTSPGPAEGKSTLTISLAITMANSGRRVVLVDTDLRRPRLHKALGNSAAGGITSVLAGDRTLEESVQPTVVDNLSVLPCGPIPPNPSELLHTAKFGALLETLKERFDLVIFDSPPVGVVIDAAIVGPQVDGAIIVAESGRTSRDALGHALRQMRDVGTNVLGCVLNDVNLAKHGAYGGYYYYSGGYYYGNADDANGNIDGGGGGSLSSGAQASPPAE
jgi:succinoglycan biosynthesis transport protein ExoP